MTRGGEENSLFSASSAASAGLSVPVPVPVPISGRVCRPVRNSLHWQGLIVHKHAARSRFSSNLAPASSPSPPSRSTPPSAVACLMDHCIWLVLYRACERRCCLQHRPARLDTTQNNPPRAVRDQSPRGGGRVSRLLDPGPTKHAPTHPLAQTSVASAGQNDHSRKPQAPTRRRRSRIFSAQSNLRSILQPPIPSEPNRPLCPSSPAAFCPRHPTLTCWPFDLGAAQSRPLAVQAGVASFALGVSSLPPRRVPGQSAAQPVPLSPFPCPSLPVSPFARPTPLRRSAWLEPGCFACLAAPRPRHRRWPIVSPPHPHQVCYRAHTNPGSDKHALPPREPTAVGQACFMFAGEAPRGWRMPPSCFAGPVAHPRG